MCNFTVTIGFGGGPITVVFLLGIGLAALTYIEMKNWIIAFLYDVIEGNAKSRYLKNQRIGYTIRIIFGMILWGIWDFSFVMTLLGCFYALFGGH